jgi:hypothetical protein
LELLQAIINDAWARGDISLPVEEDFGQRYHVIV